MRLAAAAAAADAACIIATAREKSNVQVNLPMICCVVTPGVMATVHKYCIATRPCSRCVLVEFVC